MLKKSPGTKFAVEAVEGSVMLRPAAFAANDIYIAKSVFLETEWVLRFSYRLERAALLRGLSALLGMAAVTAYLQHPSLLQWRMEDILQGRNPTNSMG